MFVCRQPDVDVEIDIAPPFVIVRAEVDVVAVPATVVVEKKRSPPAFLSVHCAKPPPAERES